MNRIKSIVLTLCFLTAAGFQTVSAQTSAFIYQGRLTDGPVSASGTYQMTFKLYDAVSGGTQIGSTVTDNSVAVASGAFAVQLDFGTSPFGAGADRWLEIAVKKAAEPGFTTLSPRQQITSSPYAVRTVSATSADNLSAACVACVSDAQINSIAGAKVTGTVANAANATNAANVTGVVPVANGGTGSATKNFVDLTTAQTVGGNKSFSGNVTVAGTLTGTLGQTASTVYSTAGLTVTPAAGFTLIPGLTQTINVPAGYQVYIHTDGGLITTSTATTGYSTVDVTILIDGIFPGNANYRRVTAANTTGLTTTMANWSFGSVQTIAPGSHTITVSAAGIGGANATVAGTNTTVLQASLTVVLVKN
ncbi:MAG: hypothetical protein JSS81_27670 [Acidobacteria bacterium]|nr:hypothetical protein [Acidobacteriota bacterium]